MKIAIVRRSNDFSARWIDYCEKNGISYVIVDPFCVDIVNQVRDCACFMWHFYHDDYRDKLFAKQLIYSLENIGIKCFPNPRTMWHFDDKLGQKYLLEAIEAPFVMSYVFYTKKEALTWINSTAFPKVFKLRGGAGAYNVKLIKTTNEAIKIVNKAFSKGFSSDYKKTSFLESVRKWKAKQITTYEVVKKIAALVLKQHINVKMTPREIGYVYFQEFVPNNTFDIRVCVVGDKAFALKRLTRKGDFRASGSGNIVYDKNQIDERCVRIAFDINKKIKAQSIAYDFVFDVQNIPLIVEISYAYAVRAYDKCEGYWDKNLNWHPGENFNFCGWMVEDLIRRCEDEKNTDIQ